MCLVSQANTRPTQKTHCGRQDICFGVLMSGQMLYWKNIFGHSNMYSNIPSRDLSSNHGCGKLKENKTLQNPSYASMFAGRVSLMAGSVRETSVFDELSPSTTIFE